MDFSTAPVRRRPTQYFSEEERRIARKRTLTVYNDRKMAQRLQLHEDLAAEQARTQQLQNEIEAIIQYCIDALQNNNILEADRKEIGERLRAAGVDI